jgi:hypothetical protein
MTAAKTGWGGEFHFDNNSGALTELVEVVSFTLPNGQTEQLDATHLKSPNRRREKIAGMIDDGDLQVVINYVPGEATDLLLAQAHTEGDIRSYMAVIPRASGVDWEIAGDAFVSGYDRGEIVADGIMRATVTFTLSGAATEGS